MRISILLAFISFTIGIKAQQKNELNFNVVNGFFVKNNLYYTSNNYEDYTPTSGVNLKCTSSSGFQINFQQFIAKSKWFYQAAYDRKWLEYHTTLYSFDYNPNTKFNQIKDFTYHNQIESLSLGGGRRFNFAKSKLALDLNVGLTYLFYDDIKIGTDNPLSFSDAVVTLETIEVGDFMYNVELDYSKDYKLRLSAQSALKYSIYSHVGINFVVGISGRIAGAYDLETYTRMEDELLPGGILILNLETDPYLNLTLGKVVTQYLNCGLGLTYKF
jgi:hypothetical protein